MKYPMLPPVICVVAFTMGLGPTLAAGQEGPIRLHPDNPRWFQWRGKACVLVTGAEHYGAVLNADFDFRRYLETLRRDGMNYTRLFAGSYVEPTGAFGIERNTLAPAPGRFLAPWARSDRPGYAGGGNRFDLERYDADYLARLKQFVDEADRRGVVVELTLFCSTYSDRQWAVHPLNPANNVQGHAVPDWKKLHTVAAPEAIRRVQERLARWLVRELNGFDNLFFEIQNEPWSDNHTMGAMINPYLPDHPKWPNAVEVTTPESIGWQRAIARAIRDEERRLPKKHLIAQNVANFRLALRDDDLVPEAAVVNFHYAYPQAVDWNRGLERVIGYDETGFAGRDDATYRRQAWNFVLSGGALFNHLDYSFTVGKENGTDTTNKAPGGGSPALRRQLKILSRFIHSFDLAGLNPDTTTVERASGVAVRALSEPGKQYAIYLEGRGPARLRLNLPEGDYTVTWIDPESGARSAEKGVHVDQAPLELASPAFDDAIAVGIRAVRVGHDGS
jgi:hypothetical protein